MSPTNFDPHRHLRLAVFRAGHLFMLPHGATWLNRDKPRPYVLATPCDPTHRGTLVYGSSRETERVASAAHIAVAPRTVGVNANGLLTRTFFYPGVLVPGEYEDLPAHSGNLALMLGDLRRSLKTALGIGTGACLRAAVPAHSWRGRIVMLDPRFEAAFHTRHAVVLTEHRYSSRRRYQVILPILRGDGVHAGPDVLRVMRQEWFELFAQPTSSALIVPPVVQSVWHPEDIVADTRFIIDEPTLAALERRLCERFGLSE